MPTSRALLHKTAASQKDIGILLGSHFSGISTLLQLSQEPLTSQFLPEELGAQLLQPVHVLGSGSIVPVLHHWTASGSALD